MTTHVIFDFFGTLVDKTSSRAEQAAEKSWGLLRAAGADLDYEGFLSLWPQAWAEFEAAAVRSHREFSMVEVGSAVLRGVAGLQDEALVQDCVQTFMSEWHKGIRYFDGISGMLERLHRRFTLAVVSNTSYPNTVTGHMRKMGVTKLFSHVVTSLEYGTRKPSPAIFEHMLSLLKVPPEQCVYVGDNYDADYVGPQSAGIRPLLIDPAHKAPIVAAARLESIFELEDWLAVGH